MKHIALSLLALLFAGGALADAREEGMALVTELGTANGVALACRDTPTAHRIKQLVIDVVPRTRVWGQQFEDATSSGYLAQHEPGKTCPQAGALTAQVDQLEARLRAALAGS